MTPPVKPVVLGLTGSIGMGKTTTAEMFAAEGVPVWDADAAVHRLYAPGGAGVAAVAALCPQAVGPGDVDRAGVDRAGVDRAGVDRAGVDRAGVDRAGVDRAALKAWLAGDPARLQALEAAVHPLVAADRAAFLAATRAPVVVLDIPLLFETGGDAACDATVVVSAPAQVQRARVLARPGMTEETFARLLARQMPDAEKRARADHVIETTSLEGARAAVRALLARIGSRHHA